MATEVKNCKKSCFFLLHSVRSVARSRLGYNTNLFVTWTPERGLVFTAQNFHEAQVGKSSAVFISVPINTREVWLYSWSPQEGGRQTTTKTAWTLEKNFEMMFITAKGLKCNSPKLLKDKRFRCGQHWTIRYNSWNIWICSPDNFRRTIHDFS